MRVPTIQADPGVRTSDFNVVASPEDFAPIQGLSALSRGANEAAGAAATIAEQRNQVRKHKEREDAVVWASQSIEQEKRYLNQWMADPENNSKETFANDLMNLAEQRRQAYNKPPNLAAGRLFQQHFDSYLTSIQDSALAVQERTRLNNRVNSFNSQVDDAIETYRTAQSVPGIDAGNQLQDSFYQIGQSVDAAFGKTAPSVAMKLRDRMTTDGAYATMDENPQLAKEILSSSKTLDEHTRWTIMNHIDQAEKTRNVAGQIQFDQARDSVKAVAKSGTNQQKIDIGEYKKFYPDPHASRLKAEDDALIDRFNGANDFMTKNAGKSSVYLTQALQDLKDSIGKGGDEALKSDIYSLVAHKVKDNLELQDKDPVSWMVNNHPVVKGLYSKAQDTDTGDPARNAAQRQDLYDSIVKFQGAPPPGTPKEDLPLFMSRPKHDIHLMNAGQAEKAVETINDGSPTEVLDNINKVLASYPGEKYQGIAFSDMVSLPKQGLKQEYQFAFLNKNEQWIKFYLGALQNSDALKKLSPEQEAKFDEALNGDKTWTQFSRTLTRDDLQRLDEVNGFRTGILSLAKARAFQYGESYKTAIANASKQLIESNMGMTTMNGTALFIPKERPNGRFRTDDDIHDVGRRLEDALSQVDVSQFKMVGDDGRKHWPQLEMIADTKKRWGALRDDILQHGFFQPGPDGNTLTLYYHNGQDHFEIRDNNNRAFQINLEELPMFTRSYRPSVGIPGGMGLSVPAGAEQQVGVSRSMLNKDPESSNWPVKFNMIDRTIRAPKKKETVSPHIPYEGNYPEDR